MSEPEEIGKFVEWGPYLSYGEDPATSMTITWRTSQPSADGWLKYGKDNDAMETVIEQGDPSTSHVFRLAGLESETTYSYQISRDGNATWTFKTGHPAGTFTPFEFIINGDMHAYPCNSLSRYFELMASEAPNHEFYVGLGDFVNDGMNIKHWNALFFDGKEYFATRPLMNATGNHDCDNKEKYKNYLDAFKHPYVDPKEGAYYLLEYGNVVLFFVDSSNGGRGGSLPSDEQYEWLETNLEKYAKLDRWIFLFMHHQIYSTGDFSCTNVMHDVFRPICQKYHVDAVFYGHDHHYECFWVDRDAEWGGTLFFVAGAGGGQHHIDHGIMGDREGRTNYIWPGRFLNVRKHGIPPAGKNGVARNDDVVGSCQLLGVLEPNFVHVRIDGDVMDVKCIGWQKQVYHHVRVRRAGAGREWNPSCELQILDY
jgi:acid phosphatase type 7